MPSNDGLDYQTRFWLKVDKRGPFSFVNGRYTRCWIWKAGKTRGYGYFWIDGRTRPAYLVAAEWGYGPLPKGLEHDHLCRQHACIRPDHLERVIPRVNQLRGVGFPAVNAAKQTCPKGHTYTGIDRSGSRICSLCDRANARARYYRNLDQKRKYHREWARRNRENKANAV